MSERVEQRLVEILDHPHFSPYGNPIPGLEDLGVAVPGHDVEGFLDGVVSLAELPLAGTAPVAVVLKRLGEPLQTDVELLARLASAGVVPGAHVQVTAAAAAGEVTLAAAGSDLVLDLPEDISRHVFVAVPSPE